MQGTVRAEAAAVHALGVAVGRFAEHIRHSSATARAAARATETRFQQVVQQRRQELNQANRQLAAAQRALDCCRRGCGPLIAAVADAQREQRTAQAAYQDAVRAASIAAAAARELAAAISAVESAVSGHASIAAAALTDLERRLREIASAGDTDWLRHAWAALALTAHAIDAGQVAGELVKPFVAPPRHEVTITQQAEGPISELVLPWLHHEGIREEQEDDRKKAGDGP
jgi:multidrug efflux pump subunit AcrA (membrane-fusion protein)